MPSLPFAHDPLEPDFFRPFLIAGIVTILTAGASWGAWILWQIGTARDFTGISLYHVNAHGHAQIFGWVGLLIMGFAGHSFPRLWGASPLTLRFGLPLLGLMLAGILLRTIGMSAPQAAWGAPLALVGGAMEILAILLFGGRMFLAYAHLPKRLEPADAFILTALVFFLYQAVFSVWHTHVVMNAPNEEALVAQVATWQAPLRDLQIHGLALFMVFGVHLRVFPEIFSLRKIPEKKAWTAYVLLLAAVLGEVILFLAYRATGNHRIAAGLMLPWLMLTAGCFILGRAGGFLTRFTTLAGAPDRSIKFVRIAWVWLSVSLVLLLLMPLYQVISGIAFSHAYYGAIRHAITVGFVSMLVMGVSARVLPMIRGLAPGGLPTLLIPFILVNLGCLLRVSTQILTDWHPGFFAVIGLSGLLEVLGLAMWAWGVGRRVGIQGSSEKVAA